MHGTLTPRAPSGYSLHTLSVTGRPTPGDGLATLIKNGIPFRSIDLNTRLQTTAFQIKLRKTYTICNIYLSHHEQIEQNDLINLIDQLPEPFIIGGDFNAKHQMWGNTMNDRRGQIIFNTINQTSSILLNTGSPTHFHIQTGSLTAIDLSFCSPAAAAELVWSVEKDLHGSDHWPILIKELNNQPVSREPKYQLKRADWDSYYHATEIEDYGEVLDDASIDENISMFNEHIITAADSCIPISSGDEIPHRVPWWNLSCTTANYERKQALRRYKRTNLPADLISYKRARARAKYVKKQASKESWRKYVSSLNVDTPMSKIWSRIRKMRGIYQQVSSPVIKQDDRYVCDPAEVAEMLANHYQSVSSNNRYPNSFKQIKQRAESINLNFNTTTDLDYNYEFNFNELSQALKNCKESSPGEDKISYKMLNKSHISCKLFLLAIYNKIWKSSTYPTLWRNGIILSFPKPGKDRSDIRSYRPISLTSCVGKLMEKMVNTRLMMVLEGRNLVPNQQFGFRKMRGTTDALVKISSDILTAFKSKQCVLCVSFDIEKAYDTTWRHNIVRTLHSMDLRGNLPKYIRNFLACRNFKTLISTKYSSAHIQEQGVPQGSVISCTLFSLAINGILASIPQNVNSLLYVDDLILYTTGNYLSGLERRLQVAINNVNTWANNHGFKFSPTKTYSILFHRKRKLQPPPQLFLDNTPIPSKSTIKYLGLIMDEKLEWKEHIKQLKIDCMNRMNIIKTISHTTWGADRETLLRLYRSIIRSKLDYGCFVYGSAKKNVLDTLDPVHNAAIRICTGAFRTSPVVSLYADSAEPPLQMRRTQLLLQYYARAQQLPTSTAISNIQPALQNTAQDHSNPINTQISIALQAINSTGYQTLKYIYKDVPI